MVRALAKSRRRIARRNLETQLPSHVCFEPLEARMLYSVTPSATQLVANANNNFAVDLYNKLAAEEGNIFFSPYSISTALEMVLQGARGQTATQIINVLHLPPNAVAKAGAKALYQLLTADPATAGYELSTANKLWGKEGFLVNAQFQDTLNDLFGATLESIDFSDPEAAAATINAWVEDQTHGKITELITPRMITPLTRLILVNAIYFKGDWATPFDPSSSTYSTFHLDGNTGETVKMMHRTSYYDYYEDDKLQSITIPYKNDGLEMVIMLPKSVSLDSLNGSLNVDYLNTITSNYTTRKVSLSLPAFELTDSFNLKKTLISMGMPVAFDGRADFTGIAGERLMIADVVHKAYIKVDEKGTEAAAATAIYMVMGSMMTVEPPPEKFVANHPFLFAIRERTTGAILFMGRMSNADEGAATFAATFTLNSEDGIQRIPRPQPILPPLPDGIPLIDNGGGRWGIVRILQPVTPPAPIEPPVIEPPVVVPVVDVVPDPTPVPDDAWLAIAAPPVLAVHRVAAAPVASNVVPFAVEFTPVASALDSSASVSQAVFVATTPAHHEDYSPYYTYVGSDVALPAESQKPESLEESADAADQTASAENDEKEERLN